MEKNVGKNNFEMARMSLLASYIIIEHMMILEMGKKNVLEIKTPLLSMNRL
jgi:hypothetical protein